MSLSTTLTEHNQMKSNVKMQNSESCTYKLNHQNVCIKYCVHELKRLKLFILFSLPKCNLRKNMVTIHSGKKKAVEETRFKM